MPKARDNHAALTAALLALVIGASYAVHGNDQTTQGQNPQRQQAPGGSVQLPVFLDSLPVSG